ncbi:MAG: PEP-CTERM sorting domain-containing protein [Candidatus Competibacteraceae bacterium]
MTVKRFGIAVGLLVCGVCFWVPQNVHAWVEAESSISFTDLQITPLDPVGTFELLFPWTRVPYGGLESFAEAKNSRGDLYQASISNDPDIGGSLVTEGTGSATFSVSSSGNAVSAYAYVPWADGYGDASAPADPPDLNVTANAASTVDIPDHIKMQWAASEGSGSLSNYFVITGGTGSVEVNFSVNIDSLLYVHTTKNGILAETQTFFTLEVFDGYTGDLVWRLSTFDIENDYNPLHLLVGPNSERRLEFAKTLAAIPILEFTVPYYFFIGVDSESRGVVPEPPVLALMSFGLGILLVFIRRNREIFRAN